MSVRDCYPDQQYDSISIIGGIKTSEDGRFYVEVFSTNTIVDSDFLLFT